MGLATQDQLWISICLRRTHSPAVRMHQMLSWPLMGSALDKHLPQANSGRACSIMRVRTHARMYARTTCSPCKLLLAHSIAHRYNKYFAPWLRGGISQCARNNYSTERVPRHRKPHCRTKSIPKRSPCVKVPGRRKPHCRTKETPKSVLYIDIRPHSNPTNTLHVTTTNDNTRQDNK